MSIPRVLIAGLRGGSGKTLISVGVTAALSGRKQRVAAFKKGPDYIDAAWLSRAASSPCRNLDLYLMTPEMIRQSFVAGSQGHDLAVIEGNRGLFDGMDAAGTCSSAELAKLLDAPVVLGIDCTKSTRTVAALILGCLHMDPDVNLAGVVLNQIASKRHESVIRRAIEQTCDVPVLGAIPRLRETPFVDRHLGLLPPQEHGEVPEAIAAMARLATEHIDLDGIVSVARDASVRPLEAVAPPPKERSGPPVARIGVFRDAAFQFYYPENLEALVAAGAELVEISPVADAALPEVDGLYIGGGFPETLAPRLSENQSFRASVRQAVDADLPVYAECGGVVFLGRELVMGETIYPMAGAIPGRFGFGRKPQGHGYAALTTVGANPFFPVGQALRGHEFHYTYLIDDPTALAPTFAFRVDRGYGFNGCTDGLCHRNVLAAYTHIHALGTVEWAEAVVERARRWRRALCDPTEA